MNDNKPDLRDYFRRQIAWARDPGSGSYKRIRRVVDWLPSDTPGLVLDIGCGPCALALAMAPHCTRIVSVDTDPLPLSMAREVIAEAGFDGRILPGMASATGLPFADHAFDVVVYSEVVEHIPYALDEPVLGEIARVLRPGGYLILTTWPNAANPWWKLLYWLGRGPPEDHFPRTRSSLVRTIDGAGLHIVALELSNFFVFAGIRRFRIDGLRGNALDRLAEKSLARIPPVLADRFASSISILATKP
jgi:SAM-dependent methyltransferase